MRTIDVVVEGELYYYTVCEPLRMGVHTLVEPQLETNLLGRLQLFIEVLDSLGVFASHRSDGLLVCSHLVLQRLLQSCQFILSLRADLLLGHRGALDLLQRLPQSLQLLSRSQREREREGERERERGREREREGEREGGREGHSEVKPDTRI